MKTGRIVYVNLESHYAFILASDAPAGARGDWVHGARLDRAGIPMLRGEPVEYRVGLGHGGRQEVVEVRAA